MKKRLNLTELQVKSFVTKFSVAPEVKGGAPVSLGPPLTTINPTAFQLNCCSGFTCGVCAYPTNSNIPECG